jgi:hypothetical protein
MKSLRETVARTLWRNNRHDGRENTYPYERLIEPTKDDLLRLADATLAALGLDDWDAAIERVRRECATGFYQMPHELLPYDVKARRIMAALFPDIPAAAFLATDAKGSSDDCPRWEQAGCLK